MTLYKIEGGPTWWVAARREAEAVALWVLSMFDEGAISEIANELSDFTIEKVGYTEARETKCRIEGEPDATMWVAHSQAMIDGVPKVIACSEW